MQLPIGHYPGWLPGAVFLTLIRPLDANGELAELRNNPRCHREGLAIVCEPSD
jgi:hypothetical protein